MLHYFDVHLQKYVTDSAGNNCAQKIRDFLQFPVTAVRVVKGYTVAGIDAAKAEKICSLAVLHDPVLQKIFPRAQASTADWILEIGFRPGVTDNEGRTARDTLALTLHAPKESLAVYTTTQYHISGSLGRDQVEQIANDLLANELIQRFSLTNGASWNAAPGFPLQSAQVQGTASKEVQQILLASMDDAALMAFSQKNTLALSLEEMHTIRHYYTRPEIQAQRKAMQLPDTATDAEIEVLAQTWSEHCKHKIFAAHIDYEDGETGEKEAIDSLYRTYIQGSTAQLRKEMGADDFCRSVFVDNAGVVAFSETHDMCIKVETHNSPSALDPYGGALTGIVGVNRDPMGTGLGAQLICNMDVFCFASPFYDEELPPRLLHPRRIMEGVREGVEDGGNKSGIPTVNGSVVFDARFLGKPLVYCGTVGLIPREVAGRPGYTKKAKVGDHIIMAGGRIGKDGIHGATFSSEELHENSPATAVQIGDPITQRKLYDFIIRARDRGLYNAITDNGAGGLSSSVGEMAEDTNGCCIDLALAPLKYDGLKPWEILLSEAQERMTLAVPSQHLATFLSLAAEMDVEATALGTFTDSGFFHVLYEDVPVAYLDMHFLHKGTPQMQLLARWKQPDCAKPAQDTRIADAGIDQEKLLHSMLGRLNICSKEYMIRQYDHEVKGGSVIKPLMGVMRDAPMDAAVLRPVLDSEAGIVLGHGICPKFSDYDTYWMMAGAIDEAVRNAVAVGADPTTLAGVDNFCWCDPVQSEKTPDGHYKLAQLVRANKALADFCLAYKVPCISGKDSMKNDYTGGGKTISIPPTVLFSVLGRIPNINKAMSSDFKRAGDAVYLLGITRRELAGSELQQELAINTSYVPRVAAASAKARYAAVYAAIGQGLISACHDCSDGGLAVALAEMALGGRLGATVDVALAPREGELSWTELLYAESHSRLVVTVPAAQVAAFNTLFAGQEMACIGTVTERPVLALYAGTACLCEADVTALAASFKATLDW